MIHIQKLVWSYCFTTEVHLHCFLFLLKIGCLIEGFMQFWWGKFYFLGSIENVKIFVNLEEHAYLKLYGLILHQNLIFNEIDKFGNVGFMVLNFVTTEIFSKQKQQHVRSERATFAPTTEIPTVVHGPTDFLEIWGQEAQGFIPNNNNTILQTNNLQFCYYICRFYSLKEIKNW